MMSNFALKILRIVLVVLALPVLISAQETRNWSGRVISTDGPMPSVTVSEELRGGLAKTDENGEFSISVMDGETILFKFVGYETMIYQIGKDELPEEVQMHVVNELSTATVEGRAKTSNVDNISASQLININEGEFRKAACCNLSESFETTPSIDVSYADGMTGVKQIKLLGLNMPDILMTLENIPFMNGISSNYGLSLIPGFWVGSMQLGKGTASVVNGYEGNAGQINVELKSPDENLNLGYNFYVNRMGRLENNLVFSTPVSPKFRTALFLHYSNLSQENDDNKDGYLDRALFDNISVVNKWQFLDPKSGIESRLNLYYADKSSKYGNQMDANGLEDYYRMAAEWKLGRVYNNAPWRSWGFQFLGSYTDNSMEFYKNRLDLSETSFYANFIYQSILRNDKNVIKVGANYFNNSTEDIYIAPIRFIKEESNIGAFGEYNYLPNKNTSLVIGGRVDYNTIMGLFFTPRVHYRHSFNPKHTVKFQAGRATKLNDLLSENLNLLNSTRFASFSNFSDVMTDYYRMDPQRSWNLGAQYIGTYLVAEQILKLTLDYNYTWFTSGYITDLEHLDDIRFYSLDGRYYSSVAQAQIDYDIGKMFTMRMAFRYNDVKQDYIGLGLIDKQFIPKTKSFLNLDFHHKGWLWNHTISHTGKQRLPITYYSNDQVTRGDKVYSDSYFQYNTQLNKKIAKMWEVYVGVENVFGFTQDKPVFDYTLANGDRIIESALIWGPINKQVYYFGLNFNFSKK